MHLDMIEDNMVVVVPNYLKKEVIKYINSSDELLNIKVMTLDEVKRSIYFSYDEEAILYIMENYNVKSSVARVYLENIYYTLEGNISSSKYSFLYDLRKELEKNNLLKFDKVFPLFFNRKFLVLGFSFLDKFYLNMFKHISNVKVVLNDKTTYKDLEVIEFSNIKDECEYVVRSICDLINSGVDISNIKLTGVSGDYIKELKSLSYMYNLPIKGLDNISIYSSNIVCEFLTLLDNNFNFEEVISDIKSRFDITNPDNNYVFKKLVDVCNKYVGFSYDKKLIMELIREDIKNISSFKEEVLNSIEVVDISSIGSFSDYVFVLGLNEGRIPSTFKDENYFTDSELISLGCSSIIEKNKALKESLINSFYSIENLYLSYSSRDSSGVIYSSSLIDEYNIKVVKKDIDRTKSYSSVHDKLLLSSALDNYIKYGEVEDYLPVLNSNYSILYKSYDNSFTGISLEKIRSYLGKLSLSYSSMDNYYRCGFRYYINNVLRLGSFDETFSIFIGNLFHYILSICFSDDFNFDKEWDNYLLKRDLRVDEEFFLIRLKKELLFIIDYLKKFNMDTGFNEMLFEKKIEIEKSGKIPVVFKGFVDKIMYRNSSYGNLISIIDYKTGNTPISLFNSVYGISMQLPVYLYLVMKSNIFDNPKVVGIYLQKILNNCYLEEEKTDALKLTGYSLNNEVFIEMFDPGYENSAYIRGMKRSKNGFYAYTKLLEEEDVSSLCRLVSKKIDTAISGILDGDFKINPKRIGSVNEGCSFCEYRDLCYMKEEDVVTLEEYKDLSFLRGDENA